MRLASFQILLTLFICLQTAAGNQVLSRKPELSTSESTEYLKLRPRSVNDSLTRNLSLPQKPEEQPTLIRSETRSSDRQPLNARMIREQQLKQQSGSRFVELQRELLLSRNTARTDTVGNFVQPYRQQRESVLLEETFQTWPPVGWVIMDGGSGGGAFSTWTSGQIANRSNLTGGDGDFAICDSDQAGNGNEIVLDEMLVSQTIDISDHERLFLEFDTHFNFYQDEQADVDVTTDGGVNWHTVFSIHDDLPGPYHVLLPLDMWTAGAEQLQVRFHYRDFGHWGFFWQVDNVRIYQPDPFEFQVTPLVSLATALPGDTALHRFRIVGNGLNPDLLHLSTTGELWASLLTDTDGTPLSELTLLPGDSLDLQLRVVIPEQVDLGVTDSCRVQFVSDGDPDVVQEAFCQTCSSFHYHRHVAAEPTELHQRYLDVSQLGQLILAPGTDDGSSAIIEPAGAYEFYGEPLTHLVVGSNGGVTGDTTDSYISLNNDALPSGHEYTLFPFWDDLVVNDGVWFLELTDRFVIQWNCVHYNAANNFDFQIQILQNGDVIFLYGSVELGHPDYDQGASATVGIEGGSMTDPLQYDQFSCNEAALQDSLVILWTTGEPAAVDYSMAFGPRNSEQWDAPGSRARHSIQLLNLGEMDDTYDLYLSGSDWECMIQDSNQNPITWISLPAGGSALIDVAVDIPESAAWNDVDLATLEVVSRAEPDQVLVFGTISTQVAHSYNVLSTADPAFGFLYDYPDLSDAGEVISDIVDDGASGPYSLGFSFPFFGEEFEQVYIATNGVISMVPISSFPYSNQALPYQDLAIYAFWDDLYNNGQITRAALTDRFLVEWELTHYNGDNPVTFCAELNANGDIRLYYRDTDFGNPQWNEGASATVGIQGRTEADPQAVSPFSWNEPVVPAETGILFSFSDHYPHPLGVEVTPGASTLYGGIGEVIGHEFTVYNIGVQNTTFQLQLHDQGWNSWISDTLGNPLALLELGSLEFSPLIVHVEIPPDAQTNQDDAGWLRVMSQSDPDENYAEVAFQTGTINRVEMTPEFSSRAGDAGQEVEHEIYLYNSGQNRDRYTLSLDSLQWPYAILNTVGQEIDMLQLDPEEGDSLQVHVLIPPATSMGSYADGFLQAVSENEPVTVQAVIQLRTYATMVYQTYTSADSGLGWLYEFNDISAVGESPAGLVDDGVYDVLPLEFEFPYFSESFQQVRVANNGVLLLGEAFSGDWFEYINRELPSQSNALYPYWDDLYTDGEIYWYSETDKLTVQWELTHIGGVDPMVFQAVLYADGTIKFVYPDTDLGDAAEWDHGLSATVGLEGSTDRIPDEYLQWSFNEAVIPNQYALAFSTNSPETPAYAFHINPGSAGASGLPGETIFYDFLLSNQGLQSASYILHLSGNLWDSRVIDLAGNPINSTGPVTPGSQFGFQLEVNIPDEPQNPRDQVNLEAVCEDSTNVYQTIPVITRAGCHFDSEVVADLSGGEPMTAFVDGAYTPVGVYFVQLFNGGDQCALLSIDPQTGERLEQIPLTWHDSSTRGLAWDPRLDGSFWIGDWDTNALYHINRSGQSLMEWDAADFGLEALPLAGLAFDADRSILWGITNEEVDHFLQFDVTNPAEPLLISHQPVTWQTGDLVHFGGSGLAINTEGNILFAINQESATLELFQIMENGPVPTDDYCLPLQTGYPWGLALLPGDGVTHHGRVWIPDDQYAGSGPYPLHAYATPVDVIDQINGGTLPVPREFSLQPNYPNPFNPVTRIDFDIAATSRVELSIYNILGQRVQVLLPAAVRLPGEYSVFWDASGRASGIYMICMQVYGLNGNQLFQGAERALLLK